MFLYRAAVFDLDGTLLNTLEDLADSANYALSLNHFPTHDVDAIRRFVGNGVGLLIHRAVPPGTPPELEAKCLADFRAHYLVNMEHKTAPYPGILSMLEHLQSAGIAAAVVSNKFDSAVKGLCQDYFGQRIAVAIGESQGIAKKPAPDTVLRALEELGVEKQQAVYIGDSDVDIATARNAGLPCISVSWGFRDIPFLQAHGAQTIVNTPAQLEKHLLQPL
jgi:phosphoglycolate phosphatase